MKKIVHEARTQQSAKDAWFDEMKCFLGFPAARVADVVSTSAMPQALNAVGSSRRRMSKTRTVTVMTVSRESKASGTATRRATADRAACLSHSLVQARRVIQTYCVVLVEAAGVDTCALASPACLLVISTQLAGRVAHHWSR